MSNEQILKSVKQLWEIEWSKSSNARGGAPALGMLQACPSPTMIESLVDLVAEDPRRQVEELEPVIHRMLFENQFIDDGGDSVILDAFDSIEVQTCILVKVLEEVRQQGLKEGLWSSMPTAPMMFG